MAVVFVLRRVSVFFWHELLRCWGSIERVNVYEDRPREATGLGVEEDKRSRPAVFVCTESRESSCSWCCWALLSEDCCILDMVFLVSDEFDELCLVPGHV